MIGLEEFATIGSEHVAVEVSDERRPPDMAYIAVRNFGLQGFK